MIEKLLLSIYFSSYTNFHHLYLLLLNPVFIFHPFFSIPWSNFDFSSYSLLITTRTVKSWLKFKSKRIPAQASMWACQRIIESTPDQTKISILMWILLSPQIDFDYNFGGIDGSFSIGIWHIFDCPIGTFPLAYLSWLILIYNIWWVQISHIYIVVAWLRKHFKPYLNIFKKIP